MNYVKENGRISFYMKTNSDPEYRVKIELQKLVMTLKNDSHIMSRMPQNQFLDLKR